MTSNSTLRHLTLRLRPRSKNVLGDYCGLNFGATVAAIVRHNAVLGIYSGISTSDSNAGGLWVTEE